METHRTSARVGVRLVAALALAATAATNAGAQVQAILYETFPATAPDPTLPFPGGAVICTGNAVGTASGFFFDFNNVAHRTGLCPGNPDRFIPAQGDSFGGRFTGFLDAPAAGIYDLFLSSDDGTRLTINGSIVFTDWQAKASGPGPIGNVMLNAGRNPFIIDYYQGPAVGGFIDFRATGVSVVPPTTVPEPGTWALVAMGLAGVATTARRRRR